MDPKLQDEIREHLDAIANGLTWLFVSVYLLATSVLAWLWWD